MYLINKPTNKDRKLGAALIITVSISKPLKLNILGTRMHVPSLTRKHYFLEAKLQVNYWDQDCGIERVSLTLKLLVHVPGDVTGNKTKSARRNGANRDLIRRGRHMRALTS
jgi:hypothetical protein